MMSSVIINVPTDPADRFAFIIEGLLPVIGDEGQKRGIAGTLLFLIWSRVRRIGFQFAALVAQIRAGTLRPPRGRKGAGAPAPCPAPLPADLPAHPPPKERLPS